METSIWIQVKNIFRQVDPELTNSIEADGNRSLLKKTFCFDLFRNRGDFILTMGRAIKGDQRLADIFAKHMVWQAQKYREEYLQKYLKKHLQPFHQTILNLSSSDRVPCPSSNYQGSPREATFTHSSPGSFLLLKLSPSIILVCDNR